MPQITNISGVPTPKNNGEIVLYQPDDDVRLEVRLDNETVWLTQQQMSELFQKDRTVITRHISNIFKEGELTKKAMCKICTFLFLTNQPKFTILM